MYFIYDIVAIGTALLLLYIVVDFIRNRTRNLIKRLIFYSFIFYLLNVAQLTTGGIVIPPQRDFGPVTTTQFVPFYFIGDLVTMYRANGFDWFFWNSVKLTFYNFLMLMPLGVYLSILFNVKGKSRALFIVFLVSLTIEALQIFLGFLGLVIGRGFNMDDLIINTLGGFSAYVLFELVKRSVVTFKGSKKQIS